MQHLLSITLLSIAAEHVHSHREHQGPQTCGGHLRAPVGTITTPNFPNPFLVPIKCKWIIEHDVVNGTISIYFTQQYTTSGLTFTEYMYYDDTYKLGERKALTVTEENITRIKWLQVQSPVLVVELNLDRLEGTQLRALGLLSVFGFNVTYEVRAPTQLAEPTSCSAIECRLLGHCYARHDYQEFHCSCFEGYSGVDCGVGPLCPRTSNMCKNGGTCKQMGLAAVSCICAPGYTGELCEAPLAPPECGIEECTEVCKEETVCYCNPKDTDISSARFETSLQVVDRSNVNISQEIKQQLTSYLEMSNIRLDDEIEILNISSASVEGARLVSVRVWSARRSDSAVRAALARFTCRPACTHMPGPHTQLLHVDIQPALNLHTLVVNQRQEVWEGSEFILTCMAYGSPNIAFTWYKDGVKINFNATTRDIWTRTVSEAALSRRMSVLGVADARRLDSGKWSCAAHDAGRTRCRALTLTVRAPPTIRLVPSTFTVNKGSNVSITCLAGAGRAHGALGFSWARERTLLPMAPSRHVWEDLYPAGSVLKLYNVQKSSEYRCQVSSVTGTNAKAVTMWVLGPDDEACESDASNGVRWPKTAPGGYATASCLYGYSGEATRFCEAKTGENGVKWRIPNFSGCVADSLKNIYEQFMMISYGYGRRSMSEVLRSYSESYGSLAQAPGEGERVLTHAAHMLHYLMCCVPPQSRGSAHLLTIYHHLLAQPTALTDEEKIFELQKAVADCAGMMSNLDKRFHEFTVQTKPVREDNAVHFELEPTAVGGEQWRVTSAGVELTDRTRNMSVVIVLYHNLEERLPSMRTFTQYKSGCAMQYTVASQQVQVSVSGAAVDHTSPHTVTLLFTHSKNYSAIASAVACGARSCSSPRVWSMLGCELRVSEHTHVTCHCRGHATATYALLILHTSTTTDAENKLRGIVKITVSLGAAMCLVAALLQLFCLTPGNNTKLPVLLKAATAGTQAAAMLTLLECDTRQLEACPGTLGWMCALCWLAGCGTLCAQPLLLHAELAGRAVRAHSVALLAGVVTLACLCARICGGAPLHLLVPANVVCVVTTALLAAVTTALALTARRKLQVSQKLPGEGRGIERARGGVVRHTLVLLFTTSAVQAAAVVLVQPGDTSMRSALATQVAALANGVAILVCYVLCDEQCLSAVRRLLTLNSNTQRDMTGDISLSLYYAGGGEVESRGGLGTVESSSSHVSPADTYWRPTPVQSPIRNYRRQSNTDRRADIVQCVEYKELLHQYDKHTVCDLIPAGDTGVDVPQHSRTSHVCKERRVMMSPPQTCLHQPLLVSTPDIPPYSGVTPLYGTDIPKESCKLCTLSTPDVSSCRSDVEAEAVPLKSCLKKRAFVLLCSRSLQSIQHDTSDTHNNSHPQTEHAHTHKLLPNISHAHQNTVLQNISHDLDFLLNRPQPATHTTQHIQEAPT